MNYRDAQRLYLEAGWPGVLPLPARAKFPPPEGYTGRGAPYPDERQLEAWRNGGGDGNLCLRLPEGVLGIDVDAYDGKPGAETLSRLEGDLGPLPETWWSSAKYWPSGIRFFRVPPGRAWRDPGPGLEVIHAGWRYAVAWPSQHPNGNGYRWNYGARIVDRVPTLDDLPWLPEAWVKHMDRGEAKPYVTSDVDTSWLEQVAPRNPEGWERCPVMLDSASRHVDTIRQGAGRHDAMLRGVSAVVHLAVGGHRGGAEAVAQLREVFENVTTDRSTWGEFNRALVGALQKEGASLDTQSPPCRCGAPPPVATSVDTETGLGDVTQDSGRRLNLTPASAIRPKRVRWMWTDRIPQGALSLLAGREGSGKSTFAYDIVAKVTRGELPGECFGHPKSVLVCATEDSWEHTIVPRLIVANADLTKVFRVGVITEGHLFEIGLTLPRDIVRLERAAQEVGAVMLLLDPLMSRVDAGLDTHRDSEVRQALEPVAALADRSGLAVFGIIHLNKSSATDVLDRVMASKAFTAVARSVSVIVPDPDDEGGRRLFGTPKNNLGRDDLPSIAFRMESATIPTSDGPSSVGRIHLEGESDLTVREAMERARLDPDTRTAITEAEQWLREYLGQHSGIVARSVIVEKGKAEGHQYQTLNRARKRLRLLSVHIPGADGNQRAWALRTTKLDPGNLPNLWGE